jgi:ABC-type dipeptide/oligopeptide/nickel transport system permease subunit
MIAIGAAAAPIFIRRRAGKVLVVRGERMSTRCGPWASRARASSAGIFAEHPAVLLVQATLSMADAIIAEAGLPSWLGQQPPNLSWGACLDAARRLHRRVPLDVHLAGVFICISVFG